MKNIIYIILGIFASTFASAQKNEAKQLADEVTQKIKSYKTISVAFDYNVGGNVQSGALDIEGDKYYVKMMGITQIYDGKKIYTINPEDEEITISKISSNSGSITPSTALSFFSKGYNYELGDKKKNIQYIQLKSTDTKTNNKNISLGIDISTKHIHSITETLSNGKKSIITIKNFKTNTSLGKGHFIFDKTKYPGYYINHID